MTRFMLALLCVTGLPIAAAAQQRPLVTEDPETVGAGRLLIEAGYDYAHSLEYPVSGLEGNRTRFPLIGLSLGISSIAEVQIDGGVYNRLAIRERDPNAPLAFMVDAPGDTTSSIEDIVFGTKVRVKPEGIYSPSFAVRFATKLPNASNESGIGLDTTDFFLSVLGAKTIQSVRIVGNLGFGILGDATRGDRQNDVLTYGLSFARAITPAAEAVGEVNGHVDVREGPAPIGTESRSLSRFGIRYTIGSWRADAALMFGLTSRDQDFGVGFGFTYVMDAFKVP